MKLPVTSFTILPLSIRVVGVNICLSLMTPFIPSVALKKGLTAMQFSIFFAAFNFSRIVFGAIWIFVLNRNLISINVMANVGATLIGLCTIIIGFLEYVQNYFFLSLVLVRILLAINCGAFQISLFLILQHEFPAKIGYAFGFIEVTAAAAYICCLPIAGVMYQFGGYHLPFVTYGLILLAIGFTTVTLIPKVPNIPIVLISCPQILKIPSIWTALTLIVITEISYMFINVLLEIDILNMNGGTVIIVAFIFSANKLMYVISCLFFRILLEKSPYLPLTLWIALFLKFVTFLLWTSPLLLPTKQSFGQVASLVMLSGFADGLLITGSFVLLKDNATAYCVTEDADGYDMVSSSYNFMLLLGSSIGSLLAGALYDAWGIQVSSEIMMTAIAITVLISVPFILDASRNFIHAQECRKKSTVYFANFNPQRLPQIRASICKELMLPCPKLKFRQSRLGKKLANVRSEKEIAPSGKQSAITNSMEETVKPGKTVTLEINSELKSANGQTDTENIPSEKKYKFFSDPSIHKIRDKLLETDTKSSSSSSSTRIKNMY